MHLYCCLCWFIQVLAFLSLIFFLNNTTTLGRKKRRKKRKTSQAARHSLHQLRKRRHIGPKCRESLSPMEKITSGDLEGDWQLPAPDQGLESFFPKCTSCCSFEHNRRSEHAIAIQGHYCGRKKERLSQQGNPCLRELRKRFTSGASTRQIYTIKLGRRSSVGSGGF